MRSAVVFTMCGGAAVGATLSRFTVAPRDRPGRAQRGRRIGDLPLRESGLEHAPALSDDAEEEGHDEDGRQGLRVIPPAAAQEHPARHQWQHSGGQRQPRCRPPRRPMTSLVTRTSVRTAKSPKPQASRCARSGTDQFRVGVPVRRAETSGRRRLSGDFGVQQCAGEHHGHQGDPPPRRLADPGGSRHRKPR